MHGLYSPGEVAARLGQRARERRVSVKMRQEDLARAAGVSVDSVRRFERGDGGLTVKALAAIAIALGSEHELTDLFAPAPQGSLDDVLRAQRERRTARVRVRRPDTKR
jgi:transcriptional regulator with XRE-family HTH domain